MKKRKRSFLLLELLIGIGLLTLFALPLIVNPFYLLQTEIASLEKIELERVAEVQFAKIKEKIYKQEIPWSVLTQKETVNPIKETVFISLTGMPPHRFEMETTFQSKKEKHDPIKQEEHHLIEIKTSYTPKPRNKHAKKPTMFHYRLFVKRMN